MPMLGSNSDSDYDSIFDEIFLFVLHYSENLQINITTDWYLSFFCFAFVVSVVFVVFVVFTLLDSFHRSLLFSISLRFHHSLPLNRTRLDEPQKQQLISLPIMQ